MKFRLSFALFALLALCATGPIVAQAQTADDLIASKKKADMTYRELMNILARASSMMHEGILRENKQMVRSGADIILRHPAPKHAPWSIMPEAEQKDFKDSLLAFNSTLDENAALAAQEAEAGNWFEAARASQDMMDVCMACHATWRARVR